jgi:hypothetical protein
VPKPPSAESEWERPLCVIISVIIKSTVQPFVLKRSTFFYAPDFMLRADSFLFNMLRMWP